MLKTRDMFLLSAIADKTELANELPRIMKSEDVNSIGIQIIALVVSKLYKAESEVMDLIASATGKKLKDISEMSMKETIEAVKEILSEEGILDFFTKPVQE